MPHAFGKDPIPPRPESLARDEAPLRADALPRLDDGTLARFAWPGMYPLYYISRDGDTWCATCARAVDNTTARTEPPRDADVNWENPALYCDGCNERIESAYAEED